MKAACFWFFFFCIAAGSLAFLNFPCGIFTNDKFLSRKQNINVLLCSTLFWFCPTPISLSITSYRFKRTANLLHSLCATWRAFQITQIGLFGLFYFRLLAHLYITCNIYQKGILKPQTASAIPLPLARN